MLHVLFLRVPKGECYTILSLGVHAAARDENYAGTDHEDRADHVEDCGAHAAGAGKLCALKVFDRNRIDACLLGIDSAQSGNFLICSLVVSFGNNNFLERVAGIVKTDDLGCRSISGRYDVRYCFLRVPSGS